MSRLPFSFFKQGATEYEVNDSSARTEIAKLNSDLTQLIIIETVSNTTDQYGQIYLGNKHPGYTLVSATLLGGSAVIHTQIGWKNDDSTYYVISKYNDDKPVANATKDFRFIFIKNS